MVNTCAELTDYHGEIVWHTIPKRPLDIDVLLGDNSKAQTFLGWTHKYNLKQGLTKTIQELKKKWQLSQRIVER